ncbi:MAG: hypothetical protein QM773_02895 [Hyphomonadaceae bacterium]
MEKVIPLETDITPEAAVSGANVLANEHDTMLSFNATRLMPDGLYHDVGCAIVRFDRCLISKFGYPNDEAWDGIPRTRGLSYGCYEVLNSPWNAEICELNKHSFPASVPSKARHFLFLFHDSCFECLASGYTIEVVRADQFESVALRFLGGR